MISKFFPTQTAPFVYFYTGLFGSGLHTCDLGVKTRSVIWSR